MHRVIAHAESLGLRVEYRKLGPRHGELCDGGLILINESDPWIVQRATIAHECGHHWLGHEWAEAAEREAQERQAELYAARFLITPAAYAAAERAVGGDDWRIARHLDLPPGLVKVWRSAQFVRALA